MSNIKKDEMIYLDHASTSYISPEVIDIITNALKNNWGNPSNLYDLGKESHKLIEDARISIAEKIGAYPEEIFFTSGSSEGNAWIMEQATKVLCSGYEHHNIINNPKSHIIDEEYINKAVEFRLKNSSDSFFNDDFFKNGYKDMLCSWMYVNNETGEIFNIKDLCKKAHYIGLKFHSDMTQALGHLPINVKELGVDFATFTGHKIHGPKGIGFVYINKNTVKEIKPLIYGGMQEHNLRAGTENLPYILGLKEAVANSIFMRKYNQSICKNLKNLMINELYNNFDSNDFKIVSPGNSVDNILMICFKNVSGELVADILSKEKIYVSTGSACNSGSLEPSEVLQTMGIDEEYINGAIRFSFDKTNNTDQIYIVVKKLKEIYSSLKE